MQCHGLILSLTRKEKSKILVKKGEIGKNLLFVVSGSAIFDDVY